MSAGVYELFGDEWVCELQPEFLHVTGEKWDETDGRLYAQLSNRVLRCQKVQL